MKIRKKLNSSRKRKIQPCRIADVVKFNAVGFSSREKLGIGRGEPD